MSVLPRIALAVGDPAGIGPEISLKAALDPGVREVCRPVLVGDPEVIAVHARKSGLQPELALYEAIEAVEWSGKDRLPVLARKQFVPGTLQLGSNSAENGRSSLDSAQAAIEAAAAGHVEAVVAAPQTQSAIAKAGIAFDGYPTFVARVLGLPLDDVFLMLCFDGRRIAHVTLHHSVRKSIDLITTERVLHCIRSTRNALVRAGEAEPVIAVSGLNPHAGEDGLFGEEDAQIILPAIVQAREEGLSVKGPLGADLLMHENADAHIVMLHDQGHIPAKLLAKHRTAGHTIGAGIKFSSVAHGSAPDIAGQNKGDPEAVINAINTLIVR